MLFSETEVSEKRFLGMSNQVLLKSADTSEIVPSVL